MPRKKQTRQRNKKGAVAIATRNGMLRLRWTHQGKPYHLALGLPDSPLNYQKATALAAEIQADIARERFDESLARYRQGPEDETPPPPSTATLFEQFMAHRRKDGTSGQAIAARYKSLLSNLRRFGRDVATEDDARAFVDLLRSRQSALIANQNLSLLKGFGEWAIAAGHLTANPFANLKRQKAPKATNPKRVPLTADQIRAFLATIKTDRYYSSYHDFAMTLFYLGVRPSEAAGLRWKHIDWQRHTITIAESLSRGEDGRTAGYARQRKTTKTTKTRELDLHPDLYAMLQGRFDPTAKPDDLVFTTPKGNPIDDHTFSQRAWKRICTKLGIDRVPYAARHSLGSHLLESGATIPQVAATLGNTPETTARHYSHMLNRPQMPGF